MTDIYDMSAIGQRVAALDRFADRIDLTVDALRGDVSEIQAEQSRVTAMDQRIAAAGEQSTAAVNAMCDQATLRGRIEALEANADRLAALQREQLKLESEQIRHGARLKVHADWLNRIDADITALEARHSDTEHAGGDADPSEAHLQPNDREQAAGVACDAVSETAENHLPTKETHMRTITIDGIDYAPATPEDSQVRIVILQRGWVVIGYWTQDGENVTITRAKVIRRWGTTAGLGELVDGPTDDTVLDPAGTVRAHILGVVASIDADADAWGRVL